MEVTCDYIRYDTVRYAQAYSTTRSFSDAFTDGNYTSNPTWTVSGTWSAAAQYMANTSVPSGYPYFKKSVSFDSAVIRFSYYKVNTNQASFEWQNAANKRLTLFMEASRMRLRELLDGTNWITLDTNTSAVSQAGQWYDVQIVMDGSRVEVWWGTQGSTLQRILSTTSGHVTSGVALQFQTSPNGMVRFDNIIVTADEPSTTTYQYNNANEMITMATGGVNTVFTYDAWGRTATKTQGGYQAVYSYRFGDKLKMVTSNFPGEAATVYYNYDGLGKRRCKTLDLVSFTWWRWDLGWNPIQEYTDPDGDWDIENLAATFVPGLAEIPGSNPSTGSYRYYMGDHLGSVRTLRDQNKAALASYEFMPYGETYLQSGRELYRGFTGHMLEKETGLYYAPYRYYSPVASRWLTRDPLGMVDGTNLYGYVTDNPMNFADLLGLRLCRRDCDKTFKECKEGARNVFTEEIANAWLQFIADEAFIALTCVAVCYGRPGCVAKCYSLGTEASLAVWLKEAGEAQLKLHRSLQHCYDNWVKCKEHAKKNAAECCEL